jgi:hypothetical protein
MTNSIDRCQQFIQDCSSCIEEMQSLDAAVKAGGEVGYDRKKHAYYSTKFLSVESYLGKSVAGYAERVYTGYYGASAEDTLHVLQNLNLRIKTAVQTATTLLSEPKLNAAQKEQVSANLEKLKEQIAHTKEDGVNSLFQLYAFKAPDKTRDTLRKEAFEALYDQFNEEIAGMESTLAAWDPQASRKETVAKEIVEKGAVYKKHLKSTPYPQDSTQLLQIPASVVEDAKRETFKLLKNKESGKKYLEAAALKANPFLQAPDIYAQNQQAVWKSYRLENQILQGATYGTSEKPGHLCNIKVQYDAALDQLVITCGVINTKQKADEFVAVLKSELEKRASDRIVPVRIALHQLNSYGQIQIDIMGWNLVKGTLIGEKALITNQHEMSRYIEQKLRQDVLTASFCKKHGLVKPRSTEPIVTHDNTAFNIASQLNIGEDEINQLISLEAYAARAIWSLEHISKETVDKDVLYKLSLLRSRLGLIRTKIVRAKETGLAEKKLEKLQNTAREGMQELIELTTKIATQADEQGSDRLTFIANVLMQSLPQTGSDTRVRIREVERNFLFDMLLGTIVEMNCKSGLDRTGMARALWDSLMSIRREVPGDKGLDVLIDLVNKQDALSAENNKLMNEFLQAKGISVMEDLEKPSLVYKGNFRKDYIDYLNSKVSDPKHRADLTRALHYQDLVAYHLLTVALPITQESTGVVGLKYNHKSKFGANPHPLNRIPMIMQTEDGALIRNFYPTTGQGWTDWMGHTMTPACSALFERLSPCRGA